MISAADFVKSYWNVSFMADTPGAPFQATVSINKYLIATQDNIETIRANQWTVISKIRQAGSSAITDGMAARLRNGKASPDDMGDLLRAAVETKALPAEEGKLQAWADSNLGVDCTGFVIAFLVEIGVLQWNGDLNGGASCPWIYRNIVLPNWQRTKYADSPEIWAVGDMKANDIILWMKSGGSPETKKPGHIALISSMEGGVPQCAESNGADDGSGHKGPQLTVRPLNDIWTDNGQKVTDPKTPGQKWWSHGSGVIVVRPSGS